MTQFYLLMVNHGIYSGVQDYKLTDCLVSIFLRVFAWENMKYFTTASGVYAACSRFNSLIEFKNEHNVHDSRLLSLDKIIAMTKSIETNISSKIEIELGVLLSTNGYFVKVMLLHIEYFSKPLYLFYSMHTILKFNIQTNRAKIRGIVKNYWMRLSRISELFRAISALSAEAEG